MRPRPTRCWQEHRHGISDRALIGAIIGTAAAMTRDFSIAAGIGGGLLLGPLAFLMFRQPRKQPPHMPGLRRADQRPGRGWKHCQRDLARSPRAPDMAQPINIHLYRLLVKQGASEAEAEQAARLDAFDLATKGDVPASVPRLRPTSWSWRCGCTDSIFQAMMAMMALFAAIVGLFRIFT